MLGRTAHAYVDEVQPATGFSQYKPIYAIYGSPDTKVALSFKVKIFAPVALYVGYSQLMMWRLTQNSSPFRDVNYDPEIFYRVQAGHAPVWYVDLGLFEHESNGLNTATSRSWNRSYVRYSMTNALSNETTMRLHWTMKIWAAYGIDKVTNPDIQRKRGNWEATVSLVDAFGPWFERSDLTLRLYGGGASHIDPFQGGQEVTVRVAPAFFKTAVAQIVLQYFHGYGENLLDYRRNRSEFRIGLGF
ncbi:MAG: phospholipase A [Clostridia bacterium]|nr:phospholipase A [Deltaproteobacteria bacterium]